MGRWCQAEIPSGFTVFCCGTPLAPYLSTRPFRTVRGFPLKPATDRIEREPLSSKERPWLPVPPCFVHLPLPSPR